MNKGKYVFSQVMEYFPTWIFDKAVKEFRGDFHSNNLNSYSSLPSLDVWPNGQMQVLEGYFFSPEVFKEVYLLSWHSNSCDPSSLSKACLRDLLDVPKPLTHNQNVNELFLDF